MNQQIKDFIDTQKRDNGLTWVQLCTKVATKFDTHYTSGEALRSAYRRFAKKQKLKIIDNARMSFDSPGLAQSVQNFAKAVEGVGAAFTRGFAAGVSTQTLTAYPTPFDRPITMRSDVILVIADLHAPYTDVTFLQEIVKRHTFTAIVVAGDVFDFDSISRHPASGRESRLESDLEMGGKVLAFLAEYAPVWITNGNHDERIALKLNTRFNLQRIVSAALNGMPTKHPIVATEYDYLFANHVCVGHLSEYSKIPGKVALEISKKLYQPVLAGHDHLRGVQYQGTAVGISLGCCARYDAFWYKQRRLSHMPDFKQGYAIIRGNDAIECYDDVHELYYAYEYRHGYPYHVEKAL